MNLIKKLRLKLAARRILSASIKDIQENRWVCSTIGELTPSGRYEGCAMGLVAWNGGVRGQSGVPEYYRDDKEAWGAPALLAMKALAEAAIEDIPKLGNSCVKDEHARNEATVIDYNDRSTAIGYMKPHEAEAWFKRARSLVLGRGA